MSLGWGLWEQASAMTANSTTRIGPGWPQRRPRVALRGSAATVRHRDGRRPAVPGRGRIDLTALRASGAAVPAMFTELVNAPARRQVDDSLAAAKSKSVLAQRLHGLPEDEQHAILLDLVRSNIATVLGNTTPRQSTRTVLSKSSASTR
ncbi:phenolphthiocerol synthesis polyketide synthase type I Pks15/1 domain protein [Mycobacterium xenopi 3993]|nr:phenolphthiocerol synthesis polyketide synthase type I Pks15/1 domain protein [Mycobacterium xenopi 3993]